MYSVLTAIDFSDIAPTIMETAGRIAAAFDGNLLALHVAPPNPDFVGYEPGPPSVREHVAEEFRAEHEKLHALKKHTHLPAERITALVIQGVAAEKILQEAERIDADIIVLGSHGHGALHNLLVGSVTEGVLRRAACPVLVVPSRKS